MEDYNQIIFCNYVWENLANQPDDVVREFITIMVEANKHYIESGGTYPTIEYIMGMAIDQVKDNLKFECELNNQDCKSIKHEGEYDCNCDCHNSSDASYSSDANDVERSEMNETEEQRRERVRNSWINKFS